MKPCNRGVLPSESYSQLIVSSENTVIGSVKGTVKKFGQQYQDATVVLYNKDNLQPIAARKPKENGDYGFLGLTTDMKTFVVAFDANQQFNAVIQDNVVPK